MTWLALFSVVLHKWSGLEDLLIGTPGAGIVRANLSGDAGRPDEGLFHRLEVIQRCRLPQLSARLGQPRGTQDRRGGVIIALDGPQERAIMANLREKVAARFMDGLRASCPARRRVGG